MRVFLAINIPDEIKIEIMNLTKLLYKYSRSVKFVPINNLHITVKFLSEQPDFVIGRIKTILAEQISTVESFSVHLNRCGAFPNPSNARVLWIGEKSNSFVKFAEFINESLNIFRMQENNFFCHATIGRMKNIGRGDILDIIKDCKTFFENKRLIFSVSSVSLYRSELISRGAKYTKICEFKLKGEVYG